MPLIAVCLSLKYVDMQINIFVLVLLEILTYNKHKKNHKGGRKGDRITNAWVERNAMIWLKRKRKKL